jgi:nitrogen fixation NifU-like protein
VLPKDAVKAKKETMMKDMKDSLHELLVKSGYSEKAIEYFENKLNVGEIEDASVITDFTGICGDTMKLYLLIEDGIIKEAKFQVLGCPGSSASGSAVTKLVKGKSLREAKKIKEKDILEELGGLPEPKLHCAKLAVLTLQKTIAEYEKNK